jgi:DNA repair protein RadA/Sms
LVEEVATPHTPAHPAARGPGQAAATPVALGDLSDEGGAPFPTGVGELDRVLGGGLVPGSVTLVGGEPGVGKSTLLLQAAASMAGRGAGCLLICAEESAQQVRRRAERLGAVVPGVWLVAEADLAGICAAAEEVRPDVMVVDSIQTIWDTEAESAPGSITQVRACAHRLASFARSTGTAVVLVGHVTKDGTLAGPRVLEHLVDTVLTFDGERHHALRLLRGVKHRFGSSGELGLFEMSESGLVGVPDPSALLLGDRRKGTPGSAVFAAMEGYRPLLVEVQALVAPSCLAAPRRAASGFDAARLALLLAVMQRRAELRIGSMDIYVSAVGGVRLGEPGADLAVCLALASAVLGRPLPEDLVAVGEVGLGGELRQVAHMSRRLAEAARLGYRRAIVPLSAPAGSGLRTTPVATLADAIGAVLGVGARHPAAGSPRAPGETPAERPARLGVVHGWGIQEGESGRSSSRLTDLGSDELADDQGFGDHRPRPAPAGGSRPDPPGQHGRTRHRG